MVTALALLMGCSGSVDREALRALERDPMSAYVPPGGSVLRVDRLDERSGGGLDKPRPATLRRLLSLPADGDAARAVPAATARAREGGWAVDAPAGDGVTARRRIGDRDATLVLTLVRDPALAPGGRVPALSVVLEALR